MKAHRSKTMWFSLLLVILGALFDLFPTLQAVLEPKYYSISLVVIGMVVAVLRYLTKEPIR